MLVEGENAICQCYPNRACFLLSTHAGSILQIIPFLP